VKPGNIFVSKGGALQLGDFGVAKALSSKTCFATEQVGTPSYLSPEVCLGRPYNCASDVWAMGCVLHELITLHVPFQAASLSGLKEIICKEPIPILAGLCSEEMEALCMAMLRRDAEVRLSAAASLQSSLLASYLELEGVAHDSTTRLSQRASCMATNAPATPFRQGDLVEYLSEAHGQWITTRVIAINSQGDIRVASNSTHWICRAAQASAVRLVCIRDSNSNVGRKRAPSPSFLPRQIFTPGRQRIDKVVGVIESSGGFAQPDVFSRHEVASRLLGRSPEVGCRPRTGFVNVGRPIACF